MKTKLQDTKGLRSSDSMNNYCTNSNLRLWQKVNSKSKAEKNSALGVRDSVLIFFLLYELRIWILSNDMYFRTI